MFGRKKTEQLEQDVEYLRNELRRLKERLYGEGTTELYCVPTMGCYMSDIKRLEKMIRDSTTYTPDEIFKEEVSYKEMFDMLLDYLGAELTTPGRPEPKIQAVKKSGGAKK